MTEKKRVVESLDLTEQRIREAFASASRARQPAGGGYRPQVPIGAGFNPGAKEALERIESKLDSVDARIVDLARAMMLLLGGSKESGE